MRQKFYILFVALFCSAALVSQTDSVILQNGMKSVIKVVAMSDKKIYYKIPASNSDDVYSISKNDVKALWLNTKLTGNEGIPDNGTAKKNGEQSTFAKNYFGFNPGQMVFSSLSFNYRMMDKEGLMSLKLIVTGNLAPKTYELQDGYFNFNQNFMPVFRKYTIGLDCDFFPYKQRRFAYYFGAGIQAGSVNYSYYDADCVAAAQQAGTAQGNPNYYGNSYYPQCKRILTDGFNSSFIINNGFLSRVTDNFFIDCNIGLGIQRLVLGSMRDNFNVRGSFQFVIGYSI
jgi:hypothetical protein